MALLYIKFITLNTLDVLCSQMLWNTKDQVCKWGKMRTKGDFIWMVHLGHLGFQSMSENYERMLALNLVALRLKLDVGRNMFIFQGNPKLETRILW